jgi:hypothetical protein
LPNDQRKSGQASEEARFIQIALKEAGYTGQLTAMDGHQFVVAARLLVKLFRAGVTDGGACPGNLESTSGMCRSKRSNLSDIAKLLRAW